MAHEEPRPERFSTVEDFTTAMPRLKQWSGFSYRQLERRAEAAGEVLPRSTIAQALKGRGLPRREVVEAFVRACAGPERADAEACRWLAAYDRLAVAATGPPAEPATAPAVPAEGAATPVRLRGPRLLWRSPRGSAADPQPAHIHDVPQFVTGLRHLKRRSGFSYRQLERRAEAAGEVLPRSTIAQALKGRGLPRREVVEAFVRACTGPERAVAEAAQWLMAYDRLNGDAAPAPPAPAPAVLIIDTMPVRPRPRPAHTGPGRPWRSMAAVALALVLSGSAVPPPTSEPPAGRALARSGEADGCRSSLEVGSYGPCPQQLQLRLRWRGLALPADAFFGPYTKMRLMAFQIFAGLVPTGIADAPTWTVLRSGRKVAVPRWSADRVERRLREAFPEDPGAATALVRCLSGADPLWIFSWRPGVRSWGLFQFSDLELHRAGATPAMALDPDWNIETARAIWQRTRDFRHWSCRPGVIPPVPPQG